MNKVENAQKAELQRQLAVLLRKNADPADDPRIEVLQLMLEEYD